MRTPSKPGLFQEETVIRIGLAGPPPPFPDHFGGVFPPVLVQVAHGGDLDVVHGQQKVFEQEGSAPS